MPSPVLAQLRGVTITYPTGRFRLTIEDLTLRTGHRYAVLGASGAGKSTLAACLGGYLDPTASVTTTGCLQLPTGVGYIPQDLYSGLNPLLRIDAHIALAGGDPTPELLRVGLPTAIHHRYPAQLSGGQRQRVAIAFALASRPQLLIADEITSALDPVATTALLDTLSAITDTTLLFLSHDHAAATTLCPHRITLTGAAGHYRAAHDEEAAA